jgi:hypothetical protein
MPRWASPPALTDIPAAKNLAHFAARNAALPVYVRAPALFDAVRPPERRYDPFERIFRAEHGM